METLLNDRVTCEVILYEYQNKNLGNFLKNCWMLFNVTGRMSN